MGDGISFEWDATDFFAMTDQIGPITRRATMYAMRATGRVLARAAKSGAPIYKGDDPRAAAESGNLRKSIKNARRLDGGADEYSLKVGPFGTKKQGTAVTRSEGHGARGVPLYRAKMEEKYGYMSQAIDAADSSAMKAIYEAAYAKAWAKWSA